MKSIVKKILGLFKLRCPECNKRTLIQNDIHHLNTGGELNIYSCNNCKKEFV